MQNIPKELNKHGLKQQFPFYSDQIDKDERRMTTPSAGERSWWEYELFHSFWKGIWSQGSKCRLAVSLRVASSRNASKGKD